MEFFTFISQQWLLVSLLVLLVYALAWTERQKSGKPVSAHEVTRLINTGDGVLVDLRDSKEFKDGHISGALNIPHNKVDERIGELEKHKNGVIILADKVGQHAGAVGKKLKQAGFDIRRLQGGVSEWNNQGLPLVRKK